MCSPRRIALVVAGVAWTTAGIAGQGAEDPGAQILKTRCMQCHAMDLIAQQRLSRAAWDREVTKMIGWGAAVDPSQAPGLAAYLASQFGPNGAKAITRSSEGTNVPANLLKTRCTVCHATDLIDAQHLDAEGWRRELTKMIGWGAVLGQDERDILLEHLQEREGLSLGR